MCDSLLPRGLQHARLLWPSLPPRVCSDSWPLSRWCYLTIYPLLLPFPFAFPASRSFPMNRLFISGDQSNGTLASVLPMNMFSVFFLLQWNWYKISWTYLKRTIWDVWDMYTPMKQLLKSREQTSPSLQKFSCALLKNQKYTWFTLLLISAVQQSASVIHIYIFFSIIFYCRLLNMVPCAVW